MAKELPVDTSQVNNLPLGSRIRLRRHHQNLRLSVMARALGYDKGYLSKVENNQVTPSDELVNKIANYLKISLHDLKGAPIAQLVPENVQQKPVRRVGLVLAAPPMSIEQNGGDYKKRKRTIGERIERIIKMAHLSEREEEIIEERLVAVTSELLKLIKDVR